MKYKSTQNSPCYFPPLLSNGEISFAPDAEGMLGYTAKDYRKKGISAFDGIVVRAARRTALCLSLQARLFPFGSFRFDEGSPLVEWSQTLDTDRGCIESDCIYEDAVSVHSVGFIHPACNLYALRKTFRGVEGHRRVGYTLTLEGYNEEISRYMTVLYTGERASVGRIGFRMYGMEVFSGEIQAFADKAFTAEAWENGIRLWFDVDDGESITFYYTLEDDRGGTDFEQVLRDNRKKVKEKDFGGLLSECEAHFAAFNELGYVKTSDEQLNEIYKTSLYSIKCNTTAFSVAVGFNNGSWDGRYFAFDEYTSYLGLLGANRLALARRVPLYRLNSCLGTAVARASDCHRTPETEEMARFHWETGEVDQHELAPDGNWLDHVFHIPLIGIGAFHYYEYSGDKEFLRECYPMIRACAKFMTKNMIYRDGDRLYIGKCTDLERLGSSRENPFMTACGAIKLLECCAKAAGILEIDDEYAGECRYISGKLAENLPEEDGKFVPFLGCNQKSIAVFAGKFPFDVLEGADPRMLGAWEDFEENGAAYGNMYPTGRGISPWYACWKAIAYARTGMAENAYRTLREAYGSAGVFGEMFEINEPEVRLKPWFATAAGIFVASVNDMLLQCEDDRIRILPGLPHTVDAEFRLAGRGGIVAEVKVEKGKLVYVNLTKNGVCVNDRYKTDF